MAEEATWELRHRRWTNPYRYLQEFRAISVREIDGDCVLSLRRCLWLQLFEFVGHNEAPASSLEFNQGYNAYLESQVPGEMPIPRPLRRVCPIPVNVLGTFTEIDLEMRNGIVIRGAMERGWGNSIFRIVDDGVARAEGSIGNARRAKRFVGGCRKLLNILYLLKVRGTRFIRVTTALRYLLLPNTPWKEPDGVKEHSEVALYKNNAHLVTAEELWLDVVRNGPPCNLKLQKWTAQMADGNVDFYQVDG